MAPSSFPLKPVPKEHDDFHKSEENHSSAEKSDDESNWLVSYADMMTLLCAFFIMLFSMSQISHKKFQQVRQAIASHFGGDVKSDGTDLARFYSQWIESAELKSQAHTITDPNSEGIGIVFQSSLLFDTLSAYVKPEGKTVFQKLIDELSARQTAEQHRFKIIIEGHTDPSPVTGGVYASNWELSAARAIAVQRLFLEHGFDPKQLIAIGYADTRIGTRSVVVRIFETETETVPWDSLELGPQPLPAVNTAH